MFAIVPHPNVPRWPNTYAIGPVEAVSTHTLLILGRQVAHKQGSTITCMVNAVEPL